MELFPLDLLLLRHPDHDRVRRLRGPAAGQFSGEEARVRHIRPLLHHVRLGHHHRFAQLDGAQVYDHEHRGRETRRAAGYSGMCMMMIRKSLSLLYNAHRVFIFYAESFDILLTFPLPGIFHPILETI